jgi:LuxR family maltose regulon positive regulatory protein
MEISASPLILTKLCVPTLRPYIVPRTRLIERLTSENEASLVLVCAPAGYGKTTLLAEWSKALQQTGFTIAWYALDSSDNAPNLFGSYLVTSLMQILGPVNELTHACQLLQTSPEINLQRIMPAVINAIASTDLNCVLILDDYHLINSPTIHYALAFLLDHLPHNLRVAVGSRSDPELPLARLRAHGQLLEIRLGDLRFTQEESNQFLNEKMKLDLQSGLVTTLEERTEGWIAGLQLAALSLSERQDKAGFVASFSGVNRYLSDYLLNEVVSHQKDETQLFLFYTSILERFCASLCDALLDQSADSEGIIEQMEQSNLFILPLDDRRFWFRYHPLFKDFLQTRLQKTHPGRVALLHRTASKWYAAHGFLSEAVEHALRTQDWEFAAALVEQQGIEAALRGEFSTLYEWSSAFPEEVMKTHPSLCLFQANSLAIGYRRQNQKKIEERLRQVELAAETETDKQSSHLLLAQAATTHTVLEALTPDPTLDPRSHFPLAQKTLNLLSADDPARSAVGLSIAYAHMALHDAAAAFHVLDEVRQDALICQNYFGFVEATFHQSRLAAIQGHLQLAADICIQGRADASATLPPSTKELPSAGCLDIALGCVQLELDQLDKAERNLLAGLDLVGWGMNPYYLMIACLTLFRLREIQGHPAEAVEYLTRLEEAWPDIAFCARSARILQMLQKSPHDPAVHLKAVAWSRNNFPSIDGETHLPGMGPFGAAEAYYLAYLAWSRIQIATNNAHVVFPYLEKQLALAKTNSLTSRLIELSLVQAQAWHEVGDDRQARKALDCTLAAAQPAGYLRIFGQGKPLANLLSTIAISGVYKDYIKLILSTTEENVFSDQKSQINNGIVLSRREIEVLHLMAEGASNQAIADRLVISIGTVKSHINHILNKLNAVNRTEAVARARQFGWLDI